MTVVAAFLGSSCSGKSAIMMRKMTGRFIYTSDPTVEDSYDLSVELDGEITQLRVWDTSGVEESLAVVDYLAKQASVIVFVFSVLSKTTFNGLDVYIASREASNGNKAHILVGNMADDEERREVTTEEAEEFARAHGMKYIETSAKTNQNIDALFELIVREFKDKVGSPPVDTEPDRGKGLCEVF